MSKIKIFCDQASSNARKIFTKNKFDVLDNYKKTDILWIRKKYEEFLINVGTQQIINHIPGEQQITTKGHLTKNIKYNSNVDYHKFYKESYMLYDAKDLDKFFNNTINNNDLWVLKPVDLSKGRGVKIIDDLKTLKKILSNQNKGIYKIKYKSLFYYDNEKYDFIIQRHIDNPLLLNKKKSEMRVYWLILSIEPLSVIIYNDVTVRLCSHDYSVDDFSNPLQHITNVYQQKLHNEDLDENELKWCLDMLKDCVLEQQLTNDKYFFEKKVMPAIKFAIANIVKSAKNNIINSTLYKSQEHLTSFNYFGLYGCDIMLDTDLNPWVLEIQKGPGLSFDHPHKENVLLPAIKHGINSLYYYKYKRDSHCRLPGMYTWLIYKDEDILD